MGKSAGKKDSEKRRRQRQKQEKRTGLPQGALAAQGGVGKQKWDKSGQGHGKKSQQSAETTNFSRRVRCVRASRGSGAHEHRNSPYQVEG